MHLLCYTQQLIPHVQVAVVLSKVKLSTCLKGLAKGQQVVLGCGVIPHIRQDHLAARGLAIYQHHCALMRGYSHGTIAIADDLTIEGLGVDESLTHVGQMLGSTRVDDPGVVREEPAGGEG